MSGTPSPPGAHDPHRDDRATLARIARRVMIERGLRPEPSPDARAQAAAITTAPIDSGAGIRDLRALAWCSIDNDDSRDLDQLSVAREESAGAATVLVAVADVDAAVPLGTPLDADAAANTTSVYTPGGIFPMLPERLSTDLTSLNPDADRMALVVEFTVAADGALGASSVYRAQVRNRAKLAYPGVAAWLEGKAPAPAALARVPELERLLRLQDAVAQRLRRRRHESGALDLQTLRTHAVYDDGRLAGLAPDEKNRAQELIEDFMVAANGVTARFLEAHGFASVRRVLQAPERWERIVQLAGQYAERLPRTPDAVALGRFLASRRAHDPQRFPDVSLAVVKLLGRGEYAVEVPGQRAEGHFGLAVTDYAHSTAPNRRYPDLVTQRLIKAALAGRPAPYDAAALAALARHCTVQEDAASKVERQVHKAAAALLLESRVGEVFDAIVTGVNDRGTWVRVFRPPVEGRVVRGAAGMDVGERARVKLVDTDAERGYIDFARA